MAPWAWRQRQRSKAAGTKARDRGESDTRTEAQRLYERPKPGDAHWLDGNGDREAGPCRDCHYPVTVIGPAPSLGRNRRVAT